MARLTGDFIARARIDHEGNILESQEPLAHLQLCCGGAIPGPLAIQELREAVLHCLASDTRLTRKFTAFDGENVIEAWVDLVPSKKGLGGCIIGVSEWSAKPAEFSADPDEDMRRREVDLSLAELTARLDASQGLLAVDGYAHDILPTVKAMRAAMGKPWTDFVTLPGNSHKQPMHWRLLNGANCKIEGSLRDWTAHLVPIGTGENGAVEGLELYLTPHQVLPPQIVIPQVDDNVSRSIGRELAPVLRRPISRIIANAETIRTRMAGPLADEYSAYAADIAHAGQHLLSLLDDLADLEVVESEGFTTAPDKIDLADVIRRAAGIVSVRAQGKGITLDLPGADVHVKATAEFRRVLQILLNLVGNAIRYSPEGSTITVAISMHKGMARLSVCDQGPGLDDEQKVAVFKKFERLGRMGDGGSGLGLYISRSIARALGGELSVQSKPGQGACFFLDLPPVK